MDPFTCSSQGKTLFWALLFIWCVCVYSCTSVSCAEYKSEQKTSRLSVCLHVCAEVRRGQGGGCCDDRNKNIFTVRDLEATHLHIHALRITTTKECTPTASSESHNYAIISINPYYTGSFNIINNITKVL